MKKILFITLAIGFLGIAGVSFAQMDMMSGIYQSQNVNSKEDVDCSLVTSDQFEELGDAYMGIMIPDKETHELMDERMGGEGSENLRQAHENMGRSYLGCWSGYSSKPMMGGFGLDMMKYENNSSGMMPIYAGHFPWVGGITMLLMWAVLVLSLIALIKYLKK